MEVIKIRKKLAITLLVSLCTISIIGLLYLTYSESERTINNFNLLRNIVILYLLMYVTVSILYIIEVKRKKETIKHKFFIYGQIYNIVAFFLLHTFFSDVVSSITKNSQILNKVESVLDTLFLPGIYFEKNFDCLINGWHCIGIVYSIILIINTILFTTLGFILGIILELISKKK